MHLSSSDFIELSKIAEKAAQEAGQLISEYSQKKFQVMNKENASGYASQVLTEVDLLSQELIFEYLKDSCKKYDLGFLGEETCDNKSRFEKDYFWCVDPIDGTLPFIERKDGYSVSIALISKMGESKIGVVYDPISSNLYKAIYKQGVSKNGILWKPKSDEKTILWTMDRSFKTHKAYSKYKLMLEQYAKQNGFELTIIEHGGAVMNAIWCLENGLGCYFKLPKKNYGGGSIWDFAATSCIYQEVKANHCSFDLSPLDLNRIDSTYMNHKGILYSTHPSLLSHLQKL